MKLWSEVLDGTVMPGVQGGPLMHVIAGKQLHLRKPGTGIQVVPGTDPEKCAVPLYNVERRRGAARVWRNG
jgi:hypothetical protein